MKGHADNRLRTIAALSILHEGGADAFADYLSDEDRALLVPLARAYASEPETRLRMEQLIRQMVTSERFSSLAEVHPAWILERLGDEPPRVIGIILRSLPSKHVRYLLKNMPPMLRIRLPDMVESFAVAGPVLETIRARFERHFLPMRVSRSIEAMGFEHLYYLKGDELEELIRDVGLAELAIALAGLSGRTLHAVFNRLDLKDAKRLQRRMREMGEVSPELFRQARSSILEVEEKHVGPERMLMRSGLAALAAAIDPAQNDFIHLVMQRLSPPDGYLLKRLIDARRMRHVPALAAERQALILGQLAQLSSEGRIDPAWGRLFPADNRAGAQEAIVLPSSDEETKTDQTLA